VPRAPGFLRIFSAGHRQDLGIGVLENFGRKFIPIAAVVVGEMVDAGLKSIFETDFKRHSEPRLPSTAQINH